MANKAQGRGIAAIFGLLLMLGSLVAAGILYVLSIQRPDDAVEAFARAPVGCTTTLEFTQTGTFYIYAERDSEFDSGECEPAVDLLVSFDATISGSDGPLIPRRDDSIAYDTGAHVGTSVSRVVIDDPGEYEIAVRGDDVATVAAIGRDPDADVDQLQQASVVVAIAGVLLGMLLLLFARQRSRRAAATHTPEGPGWGPESSQAAPAWPPEPPSMRQVPISSYERRVTAVFEPPSPAASAELGQPSVAPSPWAPPKPKSPEPQAPSESAHHGDDSPED